jgi:hypothetical protein
MIFLAISIADRYRRFYIHILFGPINFFPPCSIQKKKLNSISSSRSSFCLIKIHEPLPENKFSRAKA